MFFSNVHHINVHYIFILFLKQAFYMINEKKYIYMIRNVRDLIILII